MIATPPRTIGEAARRRWTIAVTCRACGAAKALHPLELAHLGCPEARIETRRWRHQACGGVNGFDQVSLSPPS